MSALEHARQIVRTLAGEAGLLDAGATVLAKPLTPEEAIGEPGRRDFPIIIGKERILEASVHGARGHAFTDSPRELISTVGAILDLPLDSNSNRAMCIATMNAVMRYQGRVCATVHCRDDEPEACAAEFATRVGRGVVGLIGFNPAIAEALARELGPRRVRFSDLYAGNIGRERFGVEVWDGRTRTGELIDACDVVLVTGTTLANATFDEIRARARDKLIVFGVTGAAVCEVLGLPRLCPRGH